MSWYDSLDYGIPLFESYDPGFYDEPYDPNWWKKEPEPEPKSDKERISSLEKIVEELQRKLKGR